MKSFAEKYAPKSLDDVIGNRKQATQLMDCIRNYRRGNPIFVYGPHGSGKNLAVEIIAKELGYEIVELTASDFRDYESIMSSIFQSSQQQSLFSKGKIILIDDMDLVDSGMVRGIKEVINKSSFPVVLVGKDPYERKISEIRRMSVLIKFDKIRHDTLLSFLRGVAEKEGIKYEEKALGQLARITDGDARAALIDMESLGEITSEKISSLSDRTFEQPIFETMRIIMKTTRLENSRLALEQSSKTPEEIFWWLEENIFREYSRPDEIAKAYGYLAYADYFNALIIKRQSWGLMKYYSDLVSSVSVAKKEPSRKFVLYQPPKLFFQSVKNSKEALSALEKIKEATHTSRKIAMQYIPLIKALLKSKKFAENLGLSREEVEAIRSF